MSDSLFTLSISNPLPFLFGVVLLLVSYFVLFYFFVVDEAKARCQLTPTNCKILEGCSEVLDKKWHPAVVALSKDFHTIYASKIRKGPRIIYNREMLKSEADGGTFALDWVADAKPKPDVMHPHHPHHPPQPAILLIVPGIANSSKSVYIRIFVSYLLSLQLNWRIVVFIPRGCGRLKITSSSPRLFTPGETQDLRQAVAHLSATHPHSPLLAAGFSLGGNLLAKYLGEFADENPIIGATSVAQGFDGWKGVKNLREKPFYNYSLTRKMHKVLKKNLDDFKEHVDVHSMLQAKSIEDFDQKIAIPLYGYSSLEHYYTSNSCYHYIDQVKIPLLFLNALDDPLVPHTLIPTEKILSNPNLLLVTTATGAHLGWSEANWWRGTLPYMVSWCDRFLKVYFETILSLHYQKTLKEQTQNEVEIEKQKEEEDQNTSDNQNDQSE